MKQLFRYLAAGVIALPLTLSAFTAKAEQIDIVETPVSAGSFEAGRPGPRAGKEDGG